MTAKMSFGKHKGVPLIELPDAYLAWLCSIDLREPLRSNVHREFEFRGLDIDVTRPAASVMTLEIDASQTRLALEVIEAGYRAVAKRRHPDQGGTDREMVHTERAGRRSAPPVGEIGMIETRVTAPDVGILEQLAPREEILRTCRLLMAPGDVHEVRILHAGRAGTVFGYFDDHRKLADEVLQYDGKVEAIYVTLNPAQPELLARAANRLRTHGKDTLTKDKDILRRRWMLIDCDVKKPTGISSTDQEHGKAMSVACGVWDDIRGRFGDPVVADSGNGAHLLYPFDAPNDEPSAKLLQGLLVGIKAMCSTDDVNIDLTVYNAARICKLYGTLVRKGDSTQDRPHRRSRLLEIPEGLL